MFELALQKESKTLSLNRIVLSGPRGQVDTNLLLDTGAAHSMISWNTAAVLGYDLSTAKSVPIITANGTILVPTIRVEYIAANDVIIRHVPVICHDIPDLEEVGGLLGLNFLKHVCTTIDYRKLLLRIE